MSYPVAACRGHWTASTSANWWGNWYLAGGISAANCLLAYQPKGAPTLTDSYTNIANPGTYTATPGNAPAFAAATGWTFDGSDDFLGTGLTVDSAATGSYSLLVYINRVGGATSAGIVANGANYYTGFGLLVYNSTLISGCNAGKYNANNFPSTASANESFGICALKAYVNGAFTANIAGAGATVNAEIAIGKNGTGGSVEFQGVIMAVSIYNTEVSAEQVAAVHTAMAAL